MEVIRRFVRLTLKRRVWKSPDSLICRFFFNEKWKWKSFSCIQLFATPWTIQSMEFSRPEYWSGLSLLQGIFPTQESNPGFPHCWRILYQLSHKGSPRITGVGTLFLLQRIFLTQELNWGFLHCRWILYQLSYQGSPFFPIVNTKLLHHLHSWLNLGMLNHRYEETWIQRALHGFSTHGASVPLILI